MKINKYKTHATHSYDIVIFIRDKFFLYISFGKFSCIFFKLQYDYGCPKCNQNICGAPCITVTELSNTVNVENYLLSN